MARNLGSISGLRVVLLSGGKTARSNALVGRGFVTAARPLQASNEKEAEQCKNVKEAADAVKDGAKQVKETTQFIRDVTANAADSVVKMSKTVTEKVSDTTDTIAKKAKGSVSGAWGTAKAATEIVKDKVTGD